MVSDDVDVNLHLYSTVDGVLGIVGDGLGELNAFTLGTALQQLKKLAMLRGDGGGGGVGGNSGEEARRLILRHDTFAQLLDHTRCGSAR